MGLMEARGRTGRFGFPGYVGAWPRALRSSRNQGDYQRKSKNPASDMGFFELLVTAAGQVMQEGLTDELEKGKTRQEIITKTLHIEEKSQLDGVLLEKQRHDLLDKHAGGNTESCKTHKTQKVEGTHDKSFCKASSYKKSETSTASMQEDVPEGKDAVVVAHEGLWHSTECFQNVEDACSIKMSIGKPIRVDGVENFKTMSGQCSPPVEAQMTVGNSQHGFLDIPRCSEGKEESNTNCSQFRHWIKREEGSCMTARDPSMLDDDNPPLVSSGSSEEALTCVENKPCGTVFYHPVEKRSESSQQVARSKARDDDDNSSESFVPEGTVNRSSRTPFIKALRSRRLANGNTRKKALVAGSKRKHAQLGENIGGKGLSLCVNGIACTRQRTPRCLQSKRRNLHGSPELHAGRDNLSSLGISIADGEPSASAAKLCSAKAASVASSPTSATKLSWKSASKKLGEPNVKVRITSFMVPELSVDLPETATVANLKRAVMEAAMDLLGGGLHVRVLLQGKKVPDESASLLQVGLSRSERLDSLGFMLEPNPIPNSLTSAEDPLLVLSCAASQPPTRLPRYPVFPLDRDVHGDIHESTTQSLNGKATGLLEIDAGHNKSTHGQVGIVDQPNKDLEAFPCLGLLVPQSGTLIVHPGLKDKEAMALIQLQQNPQGIQAGKRRMRRPFTVTEVEALVQAVETLGTGRWRDVKLRAFSQAKHRTYVDLKDKWKTLVHTARIAPQQRRGEPVPQELLDRVIQAHTYWAAQQANQHADLVPS